MMLKGARRLALQCSSGPARRALRALRLWTGSLVFAVLPAWATPAQTILGAEYAEPTSRYGHNVLGDAAEWGVLRLLVDTCPDCASPRSETVIIRLPESRVFEDVAPRLVDLDADANPEVVVIESDLARGARLAVYDAQGLIAATPFIGRAYRWLAPLGAADLDGGGQMELAYIDRPHLAKILRVWRYQDRKLHQIAELPGLTNHRIGETTISGGIRDCGAGPEIMTVDANWQQVMATRLENGRLTSRLVGPYRNSASLEAALNCR